VDVEMIVPLTRSTVISVLSFIMSVQSVGRETLLILKFFLQMLQMAWRFMFL